MAARGFASARAGTKRDEGRRDDRYAVVCVDNLCPGSAANVAHLGELGPFRLVRADVTDRVPVLGDVDAVLHSASPASPVDYLRMPVETLRVGSIGTLHALDLAREKQARFLLASTSETHVERPEDDPTVRRPDISLALAELGWSPQVALADGLRRTIAWFRQLPGSLFEGGAAADGRPTGT